MTDDIVVVKRLTINSETDNKNNKSNENKGEEKQHRSRAKKERSLERKRKGDRYRTMSYETTKKMINRLLAQERIDSDGSIQKKYTKGELAEKLGITMSEFKKLGTQSGYEVFKEKITLPLVSLYCSIRWSDSKSKKKFYE